MHRHVALMLVGLLACSGLAAAAEQVKPTKRFLLLDPNGPVPDPDPPSKKVRWTVKEGPGSTNTVVGDPTVDGAVLFVRTTPGASQCFRLPAAGWSPIGTIGYRYQDPGPDAFPFPQQRTMRSASIKKTPSGMFSIKAFASQKVGPIIISTHPSNGFYAYLLIRGGDLYCSQGFDSTATTTRTLVRNAPAPGECAQLPADTFCSPCGAFLDDGASAF